jgi:hypothetical protein
MNGPLDTQLHDRAKAALCRGLINTKGRVSLDAEGSVAELQDNLVDGVSPSLFQADFWTDGGEEMQGEMRAPHASSALAVNTFSRWRAEPHLLRFAGREGFTAFRFEQQLPTGLGGVPAYFDAFGEQGQHVVGAEIKCLEYLRKPSPKYLQGFAETIEAACEKHGPATHGWLGVATRLKSTPDACKVLFAAQLVKQALALASHKPRSQATLVYLYWEPSNGKEFDLFVRHRAELKDLAQRVAGDRIGFEFQSFAALWHQWSVLADPPWLAPHARALIRRYDVPIGA